MSPDIRTDQFEGVLNLHPKIKLARILRPPVPNCKFGTPSKSINYFWAKMKDADFQPDYSKSLLIANPCR